MRSLLAPALVSVLSIVAGAEAGATPSGTLIVLNKGDASASLIDLASGRVAATVKTGEGPHEVAVRPDGGQAVVTNYGKDRPGSTLTIIDVQAARVLRTVSLGEHRRPHGIRFAPDGRRLLVTAEDSRALLVVDGEAGRVERAIATGQEVSHMVAVAPDGRRAYVASIGSGTMTALDLDAGRVLAQVATGPGSEGIAVSPDGRFVWVTARDADAVVVVDAAKLQVVARLPAPSFPIRVQLTGDGRWALVSCVKTGEVRFYDARERRQAARLALPAGSGANAGRLFGDRFGTSPVPIGIVIPPTGGRAYVASAHADEVIAIDLATRRVVARLRAGREPDGLGWSPLAVKRPPRRPL
jgi:YVTN family beta-propeller protein